MRNLGVVAACCFALSVVACGGDDAGAEVGADGKGPSGEVNAKKGVTIGADGLPVGADGKPLPPRLHGKYEIATEFDLTETGLLPEVAGDTLSALSKFREEPSQTIVDLADAANVPAIPAVINAIPAPIRGFFLGFIDEHLFGALYDAVPVTKRITEILDDLASIATRFQVISTLDMPEGDALGDATSFHSISGVGYHWNDKLHVINAPDLVSTLTAKKVDTNAALLEKRSPELESGRLKIGTHTFAIPIGTFAVYAMDALAKDKFGAADFRAAIGKIIDCEKMAEAVSTKCIDPIGPGKICVGHKSEIRQFCGVGLDLLVGTVRGQVKKLDMPAMDLASGTAELWDAPAKDGPLDGTVDRIEGGFWNMSIKLAKEPRTNIASFSGRRIGDSSPPGQGPIPTK